MVLLIQSIKNLILLVAHGSTLTNVLSDESNLALFSQYNSRYASMWAYIIPETLIDTSSLPVITPNEDVPNTYNVSVANEKAAGPIVYSNPLQDIFNEVDAKIESNEALYTTTFNSNYSEQKPSNSGTSGSGSSSSGSSSSGSSGSGSSSSGSSSSDSSGSSSSSSGSSGSGSSGSGSSSSGSSSSGSSSSGSSSSGSSSSGSSSSGSSSSGSSSSGSSSSGSSGSGSSSSGSSGSGSSSSGSSGSGSSSSGSSGSGSSGSGSSSSGSSGSGSSGSGNSTPTIPTNPGSDSGSTSDIPIRTPEAILNAAQSVQEDTSYSTYIGSVLYESGYISEADLHLYKDYSIDMIREELNNWGWETITNPRELQAGDIVFTGNITGDTVLVYGGENTWYTMGKTEGVGFETLISEGHSLTAFRPPLGPTGTGPSIPL